MADKKSAPETAPEFNYGADGDPNDYKPTYGNPTVTAANDVALQKEPRFGAKMGVMSQTPGEVGGQSYPGRPTPPVNNSVPDAKSELGTAIRLRKQQTGLNRYPINEHEEKHKTHGPNN